MIGQSAGPGMGHRESGIGPRPLAAAAVLKAVAAPIRRAAAAAEAVVASILLWQEVSRRVERLSSLSDATLKGMGLERSQIVPTVYRTALEDRERRAGVAPLPPHGCLPGSCCRDPLP